MTFVEREREDLANLPFSAGPDVPTLCEGWTTRDLANHPCVCENRLGTTDEMSVKALSNHLDAVTAKVNRMPYVGVVGKWGSGAPRWDPMNWVDHYVNITENFVHYEDAHRAQGGWTVRQLSPSGVSDPWRLVTTVDRMMLRSSASTVVLIRDDGVAMTSIDNSTKGAPVVTVHESVGKLALWLYGRDEVRVFTGGDESGIKRNSL